MPDIKITPEYDELFCDNLVGWLGYLYHVDGYWDCVTEICISPGTAANKALKVFVRHEDGLYTA